MLVTDARLVVGAHVYPIREISSAVTARAKPQRIWPLLLNFAGVVILLIGTSQRASEALSIGSAAIVLSAIWFLIQGRAHALILTIPSGKVQALKRTDERLVRQVVSALRIAREKASIASGVEVGPTPILKNSP